jgi:hypothetical protein
MTSVHAKSARGAISRRELLEKVAAWNVPAESGGLLIADNVAITIDAELVLQADPYKGGSGH